VVTSLEEVTAPADLAVFRISQAGPHRITDADLKAAGIDPRDGLAGQEAARLAAISLGAVFLGAMTYIGNGPNFMVKAIAEQSGVKMPSFFGYVLYSLGVLLPVFAAMSLLFL
jgi:Na+/H+ antiporter NhaD/arsenite permease-like protein